MSIEDNQMLYDVSYLQEVMQMAYSDAYHACEAFEKYEGDIKYSIALQYMTMANQSYVELRRFTKEKELGRYEIESFFEAYDHYKFQLKQVVTNKDKNTSWLFSAHDKLMDTWKTTNDFLIDYIKTNKKYSGM